MIIGITGTLGAGKGTIVEFLKVKGFKHFSVRELLIEKIKEKHLEVNRDNMVVVANELRKNHSPSYLAEQLYEKAKGHNAIIESIRTEGEIIKLKEKGNFILLAIDADPKLRYERITKRQSETDKIDFNTFKKNENREMENQDPNKQNLKKCIELANHKLQNNGTIEQLNTKLEELYGQLQTKLE